MIRLEYATPTTPIPLLPVARDRAGDVRPVPELVVRQVVAVDEVPAMHVVDVAVVVVVDAVARDLARVGPDVAGEVGVGQLHPGVDDGDHHARVPGGRVPGGLGVDVDVALLVEPPQLREPRVVRCEIGRDHAVGLGIDDARHLLEPGDGGVHREAGLDELEARHEADRLLVLPRRRPLGRWSARHSPPWAGSGRGCDRWPRAWRSGLRRTSRPWALSSDRRRGPRPMPSSGQASLRQGQTREPAERDDLPTDPPWRGRGAASP